MFLHIDIDSFFVSAERSQNPSLKGIPVAVGGRSNLEIFSRKRQHIRLMSENSGAFVTPVFYSDYQKTFREKFVDTVDGRDKIRGIVTTSSYEARACGVKTAMPLAQALRLCPSLVVVPSHYLLYHKLSHRIHAFVAERIPEVEQFSIDEFFGYVGGWIKDRQVEAFARDLQAQILAAFDIPVSIGIARSKWTAKLATEYAKPYGVLRVDDVEAFIEDKPIKAFPGIGRRLQARLEERGMTRLGQIRDAQTLFDSWGKSGRQLYRRVLGIDEEGIEHRPGRKSIGISRTFDPIDDPEEIRRRIMIMARHIAYITLGMEANPTLYSLKINYQYGTRARQTRRVERLFSEMLYKHTLSEIYDTIAHPKLAAIKLSLSVSDFTAHHHRSLSLLEFEADQKARALSDKIQQARERFGIDVIRTANEL
jgi:DNA polymerase-4